MGTSSGLEPNAVYALGSSSGESARLQRQSDELAPESSALLDQIGLRPGDSAIDVGCGPRGVIELLAERVSPGGRVVGLDSDPAHVAMASELVAEQGWTDVEIVLADARSTGLPSDAFDLVHARTVLVTVPDPTEVLAEMVRLARPGGLGRWDGGRHGDRYLLSAESSLRSALRDLPGGRSPRSGKRMKPNWTRSTARRVSTSPTRKRSSCPV